MPGGSSAASPRRSCSTFVAGVADPGWPGAGQRGAAGVSDPGYNIGRVGRIFAISCARHARVYSRRNKIDAVGVDFDDLGAARVQPIDHLLQQLAADLGDARRRVEIGKVALRETEIAVEAVDQDFEGVLQRLKILLLLPIRGGAHARLGFEPESAQIGQQMAKNLELIGHREAIELEHDGRIERGDVAMPDVARDAGEKDRGVTALEAAHHRHLGNGMALPVVFAEEERVDAGGVAAHDHVLVVVGKNLRLDEVARAEEIGDGARFPYGAEGALPEAIGIFEVDALEFLAAQGRNLRFVRESEVLGHVDPLEAGEAAHADIVELREQKGVDEMPAIDGEFRVIDCLLRDLEPGRTGTEEPAAASPIEFHFRLSRARDQVRQVEAKKIVAFDHVRVAFLDDRGQAFERGPFRFFHAGWIDHDQFFPPAVIRKSDAHDVIAVAAVADRGAGVSDPSYRIGKRKDFELKPAQLFERKALEQSAPGRGQVMLHRIAQREEAASGALQSIAQGDQLLPTVDADSPGITQVAREFFSIDVEIGHVGIAPDERVERLDVGRGRSIFLAPVDLDRSGVAELDRDDARGRVGTEEECVFLESHSSR